MQAVYSASYIDLSGIPLVHAQRLDFGNVCTQLAMQRGAAHAQEDADLSHVSQRRCVHKFDQMFRDC